MNKFFYVLSVPVGHVFAPGNPPYYTTIEEAVAAAQGEADKNYADSGRWFGMAGRKNSPRRPSPAQCRNRTRLFPYRGK